MMRELLTALAAVWLVTSNPVARAQDFPNRPIRFIVPTGPGTVTDSVMRVLAGELQKSTGAAFVVENRAGALGVVGAEAVMNAAPDGYTLLASAISTHAQAPYLIKDLRYDPVRDFEPVSRLVFVQWLLVSDPALKFKDFRELVAAAKGNPGSMTFGYGVASALASGSAFNKMFQINAVPVPYKSQALALLDVAAGRISYMLIDTSASAGLIKDGKVQALAVASETRAPQLPNVPTFKELGVNGVDFVGWMGLHAPAKTPTPARQWISGRLAGVLGNPAVVERLKGLGVLPAYQDTEQFDAYVKSELKVWSRRIAESGIKPE